MRRCIDQRALVVLAVDLDQRLAELLEDLHADRLIVDEGARAPVGKLDAAQDQFVVGGDVVRLEQRARRMVAGDLEAGDHLALLDPLAHQRLVAARAERQRKGVEQNRLAGAGLAGEHGKAVGEIDVEPVDEDDIADGQSGEHGAGPQPSSCPAYAGHPRLAICASLKTWMAGTSPAMTVCVTRSRNAGMRRDVGAAVSYPSPIFLNALLIQESLFSLGSTPPVFTRA